MKYQDWWRTVDGDKIKVEDMTDVHLVRAVQLIRRKFDLNVHLDRMKDEVDRAMAHDAFIENPDKVIETFVPGYKAMLIEVGERKLWPVLDSELNWVHVPITIDGY